MERKPVVNQDNPYKCGYCSASLNGRESFCVNCGNAVSHLFADGSTPNENQCSNCGKTLEDNDKFCTKCDTKRSDDGPPEAPKPEDFV